MSKETYNRGKRDLNTGVKGALYTFVGLIQLPYYKALGVGGKDYQIYGSVAVTPFSVKGILKKKPCYKALGVGANYL